MVYEVGVNSAAANGSAPLAVIRTSTIRVKLRELHFIATTAVVCPVGLIRATAVGSPTTSSAGLPHDIQDGVSTVNVDTAWSAAPTVGANFLRRATVAGVVGNGVVWTFSDPIIIPASAGLVLWNDSGSVSGTMRINAIWDE